MKRTHTDDLQNKNKRFSYPSPDGLKKMNSNMAPGGPSPGPPGGPSSSPYSYGYQGSMNWVDPRMDPRNQNMNMFNSQWNGGSHSHTQPPQHQQNYSAIYNPLQPPPPPLPLDRPPLDAPPPPPTSRPPPPLNHMLHNLNPSLRRPPLNNNIRGRRPPMNNLMPGPSGYVSFIHFIFNFDLNALAMQLARKKRKNSTSDLFDHFF